MISTWNQTESVSWLRGWFCLFVVLPGIWTVCGDYGLILKSMGDVNRAQRVSRTASVGPLLLHTLLSSQHLNKGFWLHKKLRPLPSSPRSRPQAGGVHHGLRSSTSSSAIYIARKKPHPSQESPTSAPRRGWVSFICHHLPLPESPSLRCRRSHRGRSEGWVPTPSPAGGSRHTSYCSAVMDLDFFFFKASLS